MNLSNVLKICANALPNEKWVGKQLYRFLLFTDKNGGQKSVANHDYLTVTRKRLLLTYYVKRNTI